MSGKGSNKQSNTSGGGGGRSNSRKRNLHHQNHQQQSQSNKRQRKQQQQNHHAHQQQQHPNSPQDLFPTNNGRDQSNDNNHKRRRHRWGRGRHYDTSQASSGGSNHHHHHHHNTNDLRDSEAPSSRSSSLVASAPSSSIKNHHKQQQHQELWWEINSSENDHCVPVQAEEAVLDDLLRYKSKERGMMKDQPTRRVKQIQNLIRKNPPLRLDQALSMRRTHMKYLNPKLPMNVLRLGDYKDIQRSATIFEEVIEEFLKSTNNIEGILNENDQRKNKRKKIPGGGTPLTPDFLLSKPLLLKTFRRRKQKQQHDDDDDDDSDSIVIVEEQRIINWIEVKMFYGASTIPTGTNNAVGAVLPKMENYVKYYGEGAIIFYQGCGSQLNDELHKIGVTVLSPTKAIPYDKLKLVSDHQRTWCSNSNGQILP